DLARAGNDSVDVLIQTDAGEFAARQPSIRIPGRVVGIAFARMNASVPWARDLVVARAAAAPVVLRNNGSGSFSEVALGLPQPPTPVAAVLAGDLDGIPPDDLVVLPALGRPQLLLGQGATYRDASGLFAPGLLVQDPIGALLDHDGDGDQDLVFASGAPNAPFILENGAAGFVRQLPVPLAGPHSAVAVGDFDGDGRADLALASAALQPAVEFALRRATGYVAHVPPAAFRLDVPAIALHVAHLNGDGALDVVALQADGVVRIGLGDGRAAPGFTYPPSPVEPAPRAALALGDLEGDGDNDLVLGGRGGTTGTVRDSILLARGGGAAFVDSEAIGFPIGLLAAETVGAALDVDGDAEADLVAYTPSGRGFAWRNDGAARFVEQPLAPALPMRDLRCLRPMIAGPGERALVAVASSSGGAAMPPGVRLLVAQNGRLVDATSRLPAVVQRGFADVLPARVDLAAGSTRAIDDLVLADGSGTLLALVNQAGTFVEIQGAFAPTMLPAGTPHALLSGDVDGDLRPDVVVVAHGTTGGMLFVYRRMPGNAPPLFVLQPQLPVASFGSATRAHLADFDGDGDLDVLVAQTGGTGSLALLANDGGGRFTDATAAVLPGSLPASVEHVVPIATARHAPAALLLAHGNGAGLAVLRRRGSTYGMPEPQPVHGSTAVTDLVVADFDGDGDDDCALLTAGVQPTLLLGCDVHFAAGATARAGHAAVLRARVPEAGSIAAWLWSPAGATRLPLPGIGLVRLAPPIESLVVFPVGSSLVQDVVIPVPPLGADVTLWSQLAVFVPSTASIALSNPAPLTISAR
ncbi:MAG TPA: VCBS repeat-containing protein, partial [Planctomycetota bacterium]|nr:VCBS repeat-containing protein [Planctomycetota bacterium]